ncbi:MAG: hypothetical protein LBC76_05530 [Treponema sp.]|nr:hypothetical protein [Treponema sp.]
MSVEKKTLIITDESESIQSAAKIISGALIEFNVKICTAVNFTGTDLLPADIFFLGGENPEHDSFACLKDLFLHINLASRKCGIFSTNETAIQYFRGMLKDSEADLGELLLIKDNEEKKAIIENWLSKLLK